VPGGNGKINGFRIVDIQEGSLFAKLGIQQDDVIDCVDGEPLDSAAKAMEFYNALSNKNKVELCVNRKGQKKTLTYNIR
jgi:general secretion pathway protein C